MLYRPAPKYRAWWDTKLCRQWPMTGLLLYSLGKRMAYVGYPEPANDKDHIPW